MPRQLQNVIVVVWALVMFGSLIVAFAAPSGSTAAEVARSRIEIFLTWQATALIVALASAFFAWRSRLPRGTTAWWMGFGPLIGNGFIAAFVLLAALSAKVF